MLLLFILAIIFEAISNKSIQQNQRETKKPRSRKRKRGTVKPAIIAMALSLIITIISAVAVEYVKEINFFKNLLPQNTMQLEIENSLAEIDKNIDNSEYEKAIELCNEIIMIDDKNIEAFLKLGKIYEVYENWEIGSDFSEQIYDAYESVLKIDSNNHVALSRRAAYASYQDNYMQSVEDYTKLIEIYINNDIYYYKRAELYKAYNKYDLAIDDLNIAIRLSSKDSLYYQARAEIYKDEYQYEAAIKDYLMAIEYAAHSSQLYIDLSSCYEAIHDDKNMLKILSKGIESIELQPDIDEWDRNRLYLARGELLLKHGKSEALADFNKVLEDEPNNYEVYISIGDYYKKCKAYDKAIAYYDKVVSICKSQNIRSSYTYGWKGYQSIAQLYEEQEKKRESEQYYIQALEMLNYEMIDSKLYWDYSDRADLLVKIGNLDLAEKNYKKAIELNFNQRTFSNYAWILYKQNKYQEAINQCEMALQINQYLDRGYYWKGVCYGSMGKYEMAIQYISKAIEIYPYQSTYYDERAYYYEVNGDKDEAQKDYQEAKRLRMLGNIN